MKKPIISILLMIFAANAFAQFPAQQRSINDIFPNISAAVKEEIFTENGYVKSSEKTNGFVILANEQSALNPQIVNMVLRGNPGYFTESILIIPVIQNSVNLLDIYNALGKIRLLKGRLYDSHTRGRPVPLFEDATRLTSERQLTPIPDPMSASTLPGTETIYVRLRDTNFGNTYYRAEIAIMGNGIRCTLTNFRSMNYLLIPVIKEEKFTAQLYFEPIQEGVLIYSVAGADISDFFASRIDINSAISKRLAVITGWAADGIKKK